MSAEATASTQFRFRILLVDDEPSICETAGRILESEGYEVLTAKDGVDGLNALSQSLPDLIISDLNMPRMSGFEFLAVVRQRFPHIATIAMSGGHSSGEVPVGVRARFPKKRKPHHQRAFPVREEPFGCFSSSLGGKAE
jgi:CheY-like chemotaxis protein